MALPHRLEKLISKLAPQTEMERELLAIQIKTLKNHLATLQRGLGSSDECYETAIKCAIKERRAECLDRYEECVEQDIASSLRRPLTEGEEMLIGEMLSQITSISEALLTLGGIELIDPEDEQEDKDVPT